MTEGQGAESGGQRERDRLGEVGAHQLVGPDHGVEEQQEHDHQRARADRRHADDEATYGADGDSGERPDEQLADQAPAALPRATVEGHAQHHGRRSDQKRGAEDDLDVVLGPLRVAEQVEAPGAQDGRGHRAEDHEADQPVVDRLLRHVHHRAHGAHHDGRHQVARDGRRGLDVEEKDQHRGHQGPAARPGHADEESHDGTAQHDVWVNRHVGPPLDSAPRCPPIDDLCFRLSTG